MGHHGFKSFSFQRIFHKKTLSQLRIPQAGDWANDLKDFHFYGWQNRGNKAMSEWWLWTVFCSFILSFSYYMTISHWTCSQIYCSFLNLDVYSFLPPSSNIVQVYQDCAEINHGSSWITGLVILGFRSCCGLPLHSHDKLECNTNAEKQLRTSVCFWCFPLITAEKASHQQEQK